MPSISLMLDCKTLALTLKMFRKKKKKNLTNKNLAVFFGSVWFYGISTIFGYLMPNPFYTYMSNIYDL